MGYSRQPHAEGGEYNSFEIRMSHRSKKAPLNYTIIDSFATYSSIMI